MYPAYDNEMPPMHSTPFNTILHPDVETACALPIADPHQLTTSSLFPTTTPPALYPHVSMLTTVSPNHTA